MQSTKNFAQATKFLLGMHRYAAQTRFQLCLLLKGNHINIYYIHIIRDKPASVCGKQKKVYFLSISTYSINVFCILFFGFNINKEK